jgi:hypothetical protein
MKFGLVGTGYWARVTHGAVLTADPNVDMVGVWGRDPDKTASIAKELGCALADLKTTRGPVSLAVSPSEFAIQRRISIVERAGSSRRVDRRVDVDNSRLAVTTMGLTTDGRSRMADGRPYGMALTDRVSCRSTMDDGADRAGAECASARNSSHRGPPNCCRLGRRPTTCRSPRSRVTNWTS